MRNEIIAEKFKQYTTSTFEDEENALKEILQEIVLYALSTTDFFLKALFQGGTSLRILYQLPRFSEDLDFILKAPDPDFRWQPYIEEIKKILALYGIESDIQDRSQTNMVIKKLFLKDDSIGKLLNLQFTHHPHKKIMIKLEIDTNPPLGSESELKYLEFPIDYAITAQNLPSNFAGKCHALLYRPYIKGRDWFDFSWYVAKKTPINFIFLENAIKQNQQIFTKTDIFDKDWLFKAFEKKILSIDWQQAKHDIDRFIPPTKTSSIALWSPDFFLDKLEKLKTYLL
jgi:predicted nucleotidyltransferase component of viral defense system